MKAVLTGHTRGLGAAIARNLLARNVSVLAIARHRNAELGARHPELLQQVELDLADPAALQDWLESGAQHRFFSDSTTALLINNAGVLQPIGPAGTLDITAVGRAVALNVATPLILASAMIAATNKLSDRRILHVSSGAAQNAYPGWSIYCASKAALDHHARCLALEETDSLRVCSLAPGVIDTDMQTEIRACTEKQFPPREKFVALKNERQLALPADAAARLVAYLLSQKFGQTAVTDLRTLPDVNLR
ncbi:MAG: SDR family oxidoreductase [Sulfuritalea sp.]|nr:SDR family oxidoreductase [Sulfuritalea sp.]